MEFFCICCITSYLTCYLICLFAYYRMFITTLLSALIVHSSAYRTYINVHHEHTGTYIRPRALTRSHINMHIDAHKCTCTNMQPLSHIHV